MSTSSKVVIKALQALFLLFVFLVSIKLMGTSFKLFGKTFAEQLLMSCSNPVLGLFIGILATTLVQSSSATTSLVVGMVGAGVLPLSFSIPIVMGANVGTTVTNTMVSLSFISKGKDFRRAFAGATVHDFFNLFCVALFFPLEMKFHFIEAAAVKLTGWFQHAGGLKLTSPINYAVKPVVGWLKHFCLETLSLGPKVAGIILLLLALVLLFASLLLLVRQLRTLMAGRLKSMVKRYLFRNDFTAFIFGIFTTIAVQSSSVTTSMAIPLVGSGLLALKRCYAMTLGANIGTTCTALLASLATVGVAGGIAVGITTAFAHLLFNLFGILVFYPLRGLPLWCASRIGAIAERSKFSAIGFVVCIFFVLPAAIVYVLERLM